MDAMDQILTITDCIKEANPSQEGSFRYVRNFLAQMTDCHDYLVTAKALGSKRLVRTARNLREAVQVMDSLAAMYSVSERVVVNLYKGSGVYPTQTPDGSYIVRVVPGKLIDSYL